MEDASVLRCRETLNFNFNPNSQFPMSNFQFAIPVVRPIIAALVAVCLAVSTAPAEQPRVATFQCEVTLPMGQLLYAKPLVKVEHPLLAKGIVLEADGIRCVVCAVDWCTMNGLAHAMFREKIAAAVGTEASRVAVQCVHQHTAPPFDGAAQKLLDRQKNPPHHRDLKFLDQVTDRLAGAVRESLKRLEPFDSVGKGQAKVDRVAAIRRVFTEDGELLTRWSACTDPKLRAMPEGPIDPMLKTVTLAKGDKPLVRLHYYATHPQSYYREGRASYDFPGMARERIQEKENVFQIYFTGCSGDVTAGKYNDGTPEARAQLADRLTAGIWASIESTRFEPVGSLTWRVVPVTFEARNGSHEDLAESRVVLEDPEADPEARIRAAARITRVERLGRPIELTSLAMGSIRVIHLPGEPMIEFQHFAQRSLPDAFVAVAGYGLASPGYVCTEKAFQQGGYEPSASDVVPKSERRVKDAILRLLAAQSSQDKR